MNINWKIRLKNKWFWITIIPLLLLLIQQTVGIFGVTVDLSGIQTQLVAIVGTVFAILGMLGVAVDMTTAGLSDSDRALSYENPYDGQSVVVKKLQAKEETEEAIDAQSGKEA